MILLGFWAEIFKDFQLQYDWLSELHGEMKVGSEYIYLEKVIYIFFFHIYLKKKNSKNFIKVTLN